MSVARRSPTDLQAESRSTATRRFHGVTQLGAEPTLGQGKRAHGKDLRWSERVPIGLVEVYPDLIVVPEDEHGSLFSAFAPRDWTGHLPTRPIPSPRRLHLCIDAPRTLFMRPGAQRHDYEFVNVWKPLHEALAADLAKALTLPHDDSDVPIGPLPDETLTQLRRRTRSRAALGGWIAAAGTVLDESDIALAQTAAAQVPVAKDGDVVHEKGLPAPWVAYPDPYGLCLGYATQRTGPFRMCECARPVVCELVADGQLPSPYEGGPTRVPSVVLAGRSLEELLADAGSWADQLCHRCAGVSPQRAWEHGGNDFSRYHWWFVLQDVAAAAQADPRSHDVARTAENRVRARFGYRAVGDAWIRETRLARLIGDLLPRVYLVRHHRPDWLEHLELDIWIPSLRVGIEHQGQQHYFPVAAWGGEQGLEQVQARDARKIDLATKAGITLLHFRFDEPLTAEHVAHRLREAEVQVNAERGR